MHKIGPIEKLGTVWWFEFFDLPDTDITLLNDKLLTLMEKFESDYSRFRKDSLVSRLNREGIIENPPREFIDMLRLALEAYHTTKGVFNIAILNYLEHSGYDADYSFKVSQDLNSIDVPALDEVLEISKEKITLKKHARIDFGGFGKGYLIDKLANFLQEELGLQHFLINGGGDIFVSSDAQGKAIPIRVQHPRNSSTAIGSVYLLHQAFAASSPFVRSWSDREGGEHSHLVGEEAGEHSSIVVAKEAVWADIWATALAVDPTLDKPSLISATLI